MDSKLKSLMNKLAEQTLGSKMVINLNDEMSIRITGGEASDIPPGGNDHCTNGTCSIGYNDTCQNTSCGGEQMENKGCHNGLCD